MTGDGTRPAAGEGAALIGWQTLLADLSLILFMVTAAAMASNSGQVHGSAKAAPAVPKASCDPGVGEPLAMWRAGGSQTLRQWLSHEQPDGRQQLTITARYLPGTQAGALVAAQALVREAGAMGTSARLILAPTGPADSAEIQASLAYDRPAGSTDTKMARDLLQQAGGSPARN